MPADNNLFSFVIDKNLNVSFSANLGGVGILVLVVGALWLMSWILRTGRIKPIRRWFQQHPVKVKIDAFGIEGELFPFPVSQKFAWKLYIELSTRVTANKLEGETGILRESLNSLYETFKLTRGLLSEAEPSIGQKKSGDKYSVLSLTLNVLNMHLRPFLSKWHPLLQEHEAKREDGVSIFEHERKWGTKAQQMREELNNLSLGLREYVNELAKIADIDVR